jgi:hypothetical protein
MADRPFEDILKVMAHDWIAAEPEHETDEQQATALLQFVLERERRRYRADFPGPQGNQIDLTTIQRLRNPDTLGPEFSRAEGAFRRLAKSPVKAVQYVGAAVKNDRGRQAEIARKPRPGRQDSITAFINGLVAKNPDISVEAVRWALKRSGEFIVEDGEVRSHDEDAASMQLKNLPSRLTNARKRLSR